MDLHKIDFVSFKMDSFDKKSFTADSLAYSKNSMLFFYDFSKITLEYKPDYIKWFPKNKTGGSIQAIFTLKVVVKIFSQS